MRPQFYCTGALDAVAVAEVSKRMTPDASEKKWRVPVFAETGSALTENVRAAPLILKL
jgi:hypothetical protein